MHKDFAEWYRAAKIEPQHESLLKRWQGIEQFVGQEHQISEKLELVRLFYLNEPQDKSFLERYQQIFQAIDSTFKTRDNKFELSVLSVAAIVFYLEEKPSYESDILALATVCKACQGMSTETPVDEIRELAEKYLLKRSTIDNRSSEISISDELEKLDVKQDTTGNISRIEYIGNISRIKYILSLLEKKIKLQQEETNILWWVFGGYSRDINKPMVDLETHSACIIAGKELADLIKIFPGPFSVQAFLDKMIFPRGNKDKIKTTIKEAVNNTPMDWQERLTKKVDIIKIKDFCPILSAINYSTHIKAEDGWFSTFKKATYIDPLKEIEVLALSMQMYRETLLALELSKNGDSNV